ncbi:MAG: HDIG domain-containing protein [Planctomycetes bacterium]|nr:HDIG domain-containing protein [Planctomycetota bacterium]
MKTRAQALALLHEHTRSDSLRKHALAVEAVMRHFARKFGADEDLFGMTGLLHDFDYEEHPTPVEHPAVGCAILREQGYPEELIAAILGHAQYTGTPRDSLLARCLFACDELTGMIIAVALVRPGKSIHEVTADSVRKKLKDKAFARSVNRDEVKLGFAELGVDPAAHIAEVIEALKGVAAEIGLAGTG